MKRLILLLILCLPGVAWAADGYFGLDSALTASFAVDSSTAWANIDTGRVSGGVSIQIFKAAGGEPLETLGFWGNSGNASTSGYVRMGLYKFNPATLRPTYLKYLSDAFTIPADTVTRRYVVATNYTLQQDTVYCLGLHLCPGFPGATRTQGVRYRALTAGASTMSDTSCAMPASWTSAATPGATFSFFAYYGDVVVPATVDTFAVLSYTSSYSKTRAVFASADSVVYWWDLDQAVTDRSTATRDTAYTGASPDTNWISGLADCDTIKIWALGYSGGVLQDSMTVLSNISPLTLDSAFVDSLAINVTADVDSFLLTMYTNAAGEGDFIIWVTKTTGYQDSTVTDNRDSTAFVGDQTITERLGFSNPGTYTFYVSYWVWSAACGYSSRREASATMTEMVANIDSMLWLSSDTTGHSTRLKDEVYLDGPPDSVKYYLGADTAYAFNGATAIWKSTLTTASPETIYFTGLTPETWYRTFAVSYLYAQPCDTATVKGLTSAAVAGSCDLTDLTAKVDSILAGTLRPGALFPVDTAAIARSVWNDSVVAIVQRRIQHAESLGLGGGWATEAIIRDIIGDSLWRVIRYIPDSLASASNPYAFLGNLWADSGTVVSAASATNITVNFSLPRTAGKYGGRTLFMKTGTYINQSAIVRGDTDGVLILSAYPGLLGVPSAGDKFVISPFVVYGDSSTFASDYWAAINNMTSVVNWGDTLVTILAKIDSGLTALGYPLGIARDTLNSLHRKIGPIDYDLYSLDTRLDSLYKHFGRAGVSASWEDSLSLMNIVLDLVNSIANRIGAYTGLTGDNLRAAVGKDGVSDAGSVSLHMKAGGHTGAAGDNIKDKLDSLETDIAAIAAGSSCISGSSSMGIYVKSGATFITGATITISTLGGTVYSPVQTGTSGSYYASADTGYYIINTVASGYIASPDTFHFTGANTDTIGATAHDFSVCEVTGTVIDGRGRYVRNATVTARLISDSDSVKYGDINVSKYEVTADRKTDNQGQFTIGLIPPAVLTDTTAQYLVTITTSAGTIYRKLFQPPNQGSYQLP